MFTCTVLQANILSIYCILIMSGISHSVFVLNVSPLISCYDFNEAFCTNLADCGRHRTWFLNSNKYRICNPFWPSVNGRLRRSTFIRAILQHTSTKYTSCPIPPASVENGTEVFWSNVPIPIMPHLTEKRDSHYFSDPVTMCFPSSHSLGVAPHQTPFNFIMPCYFSSSPISGLCRFHFKKKQNRHIWFSVLLLPTSCSLVLC